MTKEQQDWSAHVFITDNKTGRFILVMDSTHSNPLWKLPGGTREAYEETPEETAVREVCEETGLVILKKDLELQFIEDMGTHKKVFFLAVVENVYDHDSRGIPPDLEYIQVFSLPQIRRHLPNMVVRHRKAFTKVGFANGAKTKLRLVS